MFYGMNWIQNRNYIEYGEKTLGEFIREIVR